jgi:hypothetical protein
MRMEGAAEPLGASADSALRCAGFWVVWLDDRPSVRLIPGERRLDPGVPDAVLDALEEATRLLQETLRLRPARRPWDRLEAAVVPGARAEGEALTLGSGCIKLSIGEDAPAPAASAIARHEALHLLLASALRGGEKWCDPELAFADWIVRGIEERFSAGVPRFRTPLPGLLERLPVSREDVLRRLSAGDPAAARRELGEALCVALREVAHAERPEAALEKQLWLTEAALGTHFLDAAGSAWAQEAEALRPILLDDWLMDYEQYARALANPPRGAGHLWRLPEAGWSRDPAVRLSVAAQALQSEDHCAFAAGAPPHDAVIWKSRARVRLPLAGPPEGPRPAPLEGFRAVLRGLETSAAALLEEAARGAEGFEARALWPRILARLLASGLPCPDVPAAAVPAVQLIDAGAFAPWMEAAETLRSLAGEWSPWIPRVLSPQTPALLLRAPPPPASILLVHDAPPSPGSLLSARQLAARIPVRGALFRRGPGGGAAYEQLPDLEAPLDPRYREGTWEAGRLPAAMKELVALADQGTESGQPIPPLAHLLAITAVGLEECHYRRAPAPPATER